MLVDQEDGNVLSFGVLLESGLNSGHLRLYTRCEMGRSESLGWLTGVYDEKVLLAAFDMSDTC